MWLVPSGDTPGGNGRSTPRCIPWPTLLGEGCADSTQAVGWLESGRQMHRMLGGMKGMGALWVERWGALGTVCPPPSGTSPDAEHSKFNPRYIQVKKLKWQQWEGLFVCLMDTEQYDSA